MRIRGIRCVSGEWSSPSEPSKAAPADQVTNKASSTDPNPKITKYLYTPNRLKQQETKGNTNTVDYTYYLDQMLKHQLEKKSNGTIVNEHTLEYNANGDKTKDTLKLLESGGATVNSVLTYTYDPRDRVKTYTKTGDHATSETYVHDANNNVISQTISGTTTSYNYDRNRLMSAVTGSTTAQYNYDPFGRLDTVTAVGKQLEKNTYDGFDRVTQYNKLEDNGTTTITKYAFDPLDRTTSETEHAGAANEKTTEFNYLGLSNDILNEQVAGQITKSYQYSSWGERLSMVKQNGDGTKEDSYYGYNSHSDVEDITDASGNSRSTYGYTAYGKNDDQAFTGVDKPDPANPDKEPYNFYRFNAKRWDPASKQYDMGFRDYNPGLNRFNTRDMYNGALSDMKLTTDPWTMNRYAFGGGNPVSRVELDGHRVVYDSGKSTLEVELDKIFADMNNDKAKILDDDNKARMQIDLFTHQQIANQLNMQGELTELTADLTAALRGAVSANRVGEMFGEDPFVYLYHGTSKKAAASIRTGGIDLAESRNETDFGRGFYVTRIEKQALDWASKKGDGGEVLKFKVPVSGMDSLNGLNLGNDLKEWESFVRSNRLGGPLHSYDFVEGPMLRNVRSFKRGAPPVISGNQISFHTPTAIEMLFSGLQ